jgi:c-di-GMP-binding flagellar brake protein YcgR
MEPWMALTDIFIPGVSVKLFTKASIKSKVNTLLVGYKKNEYLAIEKPSPDGNWNKLEQGTDWTANLINEGNIYSFQTYILGFCRQPYPLVFIHYPQKIQRTSLRQGKRIPVEIKALCKSEDSPDGTNVQPVKGIVRDISEGGCLLVTKRKLLPGQIMELTLLLNREESIEGVQAEVRSSREIENNMFLLGLAFSSHLTNDGYKRLKQMLDGLNLLPLRV